MRTYKFEYTVALGSDRPGESLCDSVTKLLCDGWKLHGGIAITYVPDEPVQNTFGGMIYAQAMIKRTYIQK